MKRKLALSMAAAFLALFAVSALFVQSSFGQEGDVVEMKRNAQALFEKQKLTEALPLYEELVKRLPDDADVRRDLGFALMAQSLVVEDPAQKRALRVRARDSFILARDLGDKSLLVAGLIEGLPPDGSPGSGYSDNAEANRLMEKGEAAFASGKLDEALKFYKDALALDPHCYHAALFAGDVGVQRSDYAEAAKWYQMAIAIDPNTETAYRYSATPFMRQKKYDQARDRYIEAYVIDPYNKLAVSGIVQWGQATNTRLAHPKIDIPEMAAGEDGKRKVTINLQGMEDGSLAWGSYVSTREMWRTQKFAKQYPAEQGYRHTLMEEADALRSVVTAAKALKPKSLNEQIATLARMDDDGVLEAYILLAIPDRDIAREHRSYMLKHRDKLMLYVRKYVVGLKS